jgi:hypothetical protein
MNLNWTILSKLWEAILKFITSKVEDPIHFAKISCTVILMIIGLYSLLFTTNIIAWILVFLLIYMISSQNIKGQAKIDRERKRARNLRMES